MKKILLLLFFFQAVCLATDKVNYIQITTGNVLIYANPFEKSQPIYQTEKDSIFEVGINYDTFYEVLNKEKKIGWIKKSESEPIKKVDKSNLKPVISIYKKPKKLKKETKKYEYEGQENYGFPDREAPQDFNVNLDGFFEVKVSGRNFSPNNPSDPIYQTILNDPLYKKVPRDIRIGQLRKDFRSKINVEGKLAKDLYVYYNILQEPDTPDVYDVQIKYKNQEFKFFNFSSAFKNGEYLSINKSLRGAHYSYEDPLKSITLSMGKQRSNPQIYSGFGTGQKTIKLRHRYIFEDSIHIYVNHKKIKLNRDYTVNYFEGKVTFQNPPQQNDFFKIIYEFSNPIADYIPMLARKNFFGFDYQQNSEGVKIQKDKVLSFSEKFLNEDNTMSEEEDINTLLLVTMQSFIDYSALNFQEIAKSIKYLKKIKVLDNNSMLMESYSPDLPNSIFEDPNPFPEKITEIRAVLNKVYEQHKSKKNNLEKRKISYSSIQIQANELESIELIESEDAQNIWSDLVANKTLDQNGFIREDIYFLESTLDKSSNYSLYFDAIITKFLKNYFTERYNFIDKFTYKLKHKNIVLGSDKVTLNKLKLNRNEDYFLDIDQGKLSLAMFIFPGDEIEVDYDYYATLKHEEDLIGNNSLGPYQLQHQNLLNKDFKVYLDNKLLIETRDYIIDFNEGKLYFNYEILYPSLIYIEYMYKEQEVTLQKIQQKGIDFAVTYIEENLPSDQEELVLSITSENVNINPTTNYLVLSNNPIESTSNVIVSVIETGNNLHTTLTSTDFEVVDQYQGIIEITNPDYQDESAFYVSYDYLKSFDTYAYIAANGQPQINSNDFDSFNDVPVKYNGVEYIVFWDNGVERYLEVGSEFSVDYLDAGQTIQINFILNNVENPGSELYSYPSAQQQLKLIYNYIPNSIITLDNVYQRMAVGKVKTNLTDKINVSAELAVGSDNYSNTQLNGELLEISGTGIDNDRYYLGFPNIVEGSEQIIVNDIIRSQTEDYFINYKTGYFFFKNFTPSAEDIIEANFKYYESGGALVSGKAETAYASKVITSYITPSLNINSQIKHIQDDFKPIGNIQETTGSSVYNTSLKWNINESNNFNLTHSYRKNFAGKNEIDQDKFTRINTISSSLNSKMLEFIQASHKLNYDLQVQDPFNAFQGDGTHSVDKLTYSYLGNFNYDTEKIKNNYARSFSRSINDYIDGINRSSTKTSSNSFKSTLNYPDIWMLGKVTLNPSYYESFSESTSLNNTQFSISERKNYGVSSNFNPFKGLAVRGNYNRINTIKKTIDGVSYDQSSISFGGSSTYRLSNWINTNFSYSQNENESPLLDTKGDLTKKQLFGVTNFLPYSALRALGFPVNYFLIKPIKNTGIKYSNSFNKSEKNDRRKINLSESNKVSLNVIDIAPGFTINNLIYNEYDSNYINLVQTTTVSENYVVTKRDNYSGAVSLKPKIFLLEFFNYSYSLKNEESDTNTQALARQVTGNLTTTNIEKNNQKHSLSFRPPGFYINNPFKKKKRLRLGSISINSDYVIEDLRNIEEKDYMIFDELNNTYQETNNDYYLSQDNKNLKRVNLSGNINPLNILNLNYKISSSNIVLDRNKYNSVGTTYQDQLDYSVSTGISPLAKLSLNVSAADKSYEQYRSPTINISLSDIIEAKTINDDTIFSNYINNNNRIYSGTATWKIFKFLSFSSKYSISTLIEKYQNTEGQTDKNIDIESVNYTVSFKPLKSSSISYTLSEKKYTTKNDTTQNINYGNNYTLKVKYTPVKTSTYSINLDYTRVGSMGYGLNTIEQTNSLTGDGDFIQTQLDNVDEFVENGTIKINIKYPLTNLAYAENIIITAEGYIKKINDNLNNENNYNISALLMKAVLNF